MVGVEEMAIRNAFPVDELRAQFHLDELRADHDSVRHTTTFVAGRAGHRACVTKTRTEIVDSPDMGEMIQKIVGGLAAEINLSAMTLDELIDRGELPTSLRGGDPALYSSIDHPPTWSGWCEAWRGIAWVRLQAFERDAEAEDAARDYEESIAAGGMY